MMLLQRMLKLIMQGESNPNDDRCEITCIHVILSTCLFDLGSLSLITTRFEKKKRRIAARLRTQQELMQFRSENGATLGGQWVDQKWVTRADLEQQNEKDAFHAKQWFKEVGLYVLFVFAFTWVIYAGRSNDAYIGYKQFWTRTVDKHISNVRCAA